jgi:hypothetical protein
MSNSNDAQNILKELQASVENIKKIMADKKIRRALCPRLR